MNQMIEDKNKMTKENLTEEQIKEALEPKFQIASNVKLNSMTYLPKLSFCGYITVPIEDNDLKTLFDLLVKYSNIVGY